MAEALATPRPSVSLQSRYVLEDVAQLQESFTDE
jgi:hypothetical protein